MIYFSHQFLKEKLLIYLLVLQNYPSISWVEGFDDIAKIKKNAAVVWYNKF